LSRFSLVNASSTTLWRPVKENGGETRVVDGPCSFSNASLKQLEKMIYDDVVDETFPRSRPRSVKDNVV